MYRLHFPESFPRVEKSFIILFSVESKIETESGCLPIDDPTRCYNEGFGAIKPSNAPGQIRMGGKINYTVEFTRPEYFPVDMYYLIDLSGSMKDDLDNLKKLGQDIR